MKLYTQLLIYARKVTTGKAQEGKKKVVLAGCVPQAQPRQEYLQGLSIIGVQQIDRVVEVVEETIKGLQKYYVKDAKFCLSSCVFNKITGNKQIPLVPF
ncbi:UNVERIFIED_CONTAM: hypothetical protein K2H54_056692 [Gekko kuhli]